MIYLGIDPGLTGAVAAISPSGQLTISLMPTTLVKKGKKNKKEYKKESMRGLLENLGYEGDNEKRFVTLERQQAFPGQGVTSMFSIGRGFGIWEGLLIGMGIEHMIVSPRKWQGAIAPAKKGESKIRAIETAQRLFPGVSLKISTRAKKPHTGFADAACIALYGKRFHDAG